MDIEVIIERAEGSFWGRIETATSFLPTTSGQTVEEVVDNLVMLIEDYVENEGAGDEYWNGFEKGSAVINLVYDLQAFFASHEYLNVTAIAKRAGLNPGLVRQYSSGVKYPSAEQAKKIEDAIHDLGRELTQVVLYA